MAASNVIHLPRMSPSQNGAGAKGYLGKSSLGIASDQTASRQRRDEMSEKLLAVGSQQDRAAFSALFHHFAPRVKSYLRGFGDDPEKVDEVVQEVFVAVWSKARLFDPQRASASTWIFTIARNRRIDTFRRERRPAFDPNDPAFVPASEPDGEYMVTARERSEYIAEAMSELSDEQREILRLSFFEDHSHDAIAGKLGVPIGTVKSRIRLAYGHLRTRLEARSGGLI